MGLPDRGVKLLVLVSVFWALAILAVVLRVWARVLKRQRIVFNDWSAFVALIFTSGLAICNLVAVTHGGVGQHLINTTMAQQTMDVKIYAVVWLFQALANSFVRLSFLDLLRRIFRVRAFEIATWILMGLATAYAVGCFIAFWALCRPFAANWNPYIKGAKCGNQYMTYLLSAIFNLLLDFSIILLPLPVLWGLQMKTQKKLALTAIFTVGLVVCVMTILRTVAVVRFNGKTAKMDFTYTTFLDALWSSLEPSLGVVNCCLPLFPPVMKKVGESAFYSRVKSVLSSRSDSSSRRLAGAGDDSNRWRQTYSGENSNRSLEKSRKQSTSNRSQQSDELTLAGSDHGNEKKTAPDPFNIDDPNGIEVRRAYAQVMNQV